MKPTYNCSNQGKCYLKGKWLYTEGERGSNGPIITTWLDGDNYLGVAVKNMVLKWPITISEELKCTLVQKTIQTG